MGRVVLVTGFSGGLASRVARRLADIGEAGGIDRVVGLDLRPPRDLGGVKFVRADIRTPVVAKVLAVEDIDTVVHLDVQPSASKPGSTKERNVIGTMQLLAACQRTDGVRKLVFGSSSAVYGASPRDPAKFREADSARGGTRSGFPREVVEAEGYTRGLARRRPDIMCTTLRFAHVLHADISTPLRAYLMSPGLPSAIGYDPRLQVLHLEDALSILIESVVSDHPGTYNAAGDGVMLLSQIAGRLGKPTVPLPLFGFGAAASRVIRAMGGTLSPDLHRLLTYGRALDTTALREIFGYELRYTTAETIDQFRMAIGPGLLSSVGLGGSPR